MLINYISKAMQPHLEKQSFHFLRFPKHHQRILNYMSVFSLTEPVYQPSCSRHKFDPFNRWSLQFPIEMQKPWKT